MAQENDVILIYIEGKPAGFARIEDISPDIKKDWYHVKLLLLQVPLQSVTWILRDIYIDGAEFTMNGNNMRLELVACPPDSPMEKIETKPESKSDTKFELKPKSKIDKEYKKPAKETHAKVISLADRK